MNSQTQQPFKNHRKAQAQAMAAAGCSTAIIAKRLDITPRHARRLTKGQPITVNPVIGTDQEPKLWAQWHKTLGSYRKVGYYFGFSHEHIRKALTSGREQSGEVPDEDETPNSPQPSAIQHS